MKKYEIIKNVVHNKEGYIISFDLKKPIESKEDDQKLARDLNK